MLARIIIALLVSSCAFGALSPQEVMIACNITGAESVSIAFYYARQRGIPFDNIVQIRLPVGMKSEISRPDYEKLIEGPLLHRVSERAGVRCLLLTMGMPYRIKGSAALKGLEAELAALKQIESDKLAEISAATENAGGKSLDGSDEKAVSLALKDAIELAQAAEKNEQLSFLDKILPLYGTRLTSKIAELEFGLESFSFPEDMEANAASILRQAAAERWGIAEKLTGGYYEASSKLFGLLEALERVRLDIGEITGRETEASVDSELAVMKFTRHALSGPLPNELYRNRPAAGQNPRTILVSRLDGPSEMLVKRLIRRSAEAPDSSDCLLDLRDAQAKGLEDYAPFDEKLSAAALALERAGFNTLAENTSALYKGRRKCLFYAGWYSPGVFSSRLTFSPRSVAVHIASLEARDIRSKGSGLWCAGLLEAGACCTMGAVNEPYLSNFPEPDALAERLIAGDTIAEAFFFAKPSNSWQMILIADPLMTLPTLQPR
jgi:uncharacterized protein (TIGR03790 family)